MRPKIVRIVAAISLLTAGIVGGVLVQAFGEKGDRDQSSSALMAQHDESRRCSVRTLRGSYGISASGTVEGFGTLVNVGVATFDGRGNLRVVDTVSIDGMIFDRTTPGTYEVNRDCTGTALLHITVPAMLEAHFKFVLVSGQATFHFLQTDPGALLSGVGQKQ
jgi:hypothetical protein